MRLFLLEIHYLTYQVLKLHYLWVLNNRIARFSQEKNNQAQRETLTWNYFIYVQRAVFFLPRFSNNHEHLKELNRLLSHNPVVALLGARQVGKTTLARVYEYTPRQALSITRPDTALDNVFFRFSSGSPGKIFRIIPFVKAYIPFSDNRSKNSMSADTFIVLPLRKGELTFPFLYIFYKKTVTPSSWFRRISLLLSASTRIDVFVPSAHSEEK